MNTTYDQFVTSTPPDIDSKTRIVAVLGIKRDEVSPNDHGWFLSDFAAFWHLFNGLGAKQRWFHCMQIQFVIRDHRTYLHGNPFGTRKVVLNQDIYNQIQQSKTPFEETDGVSNFLNLIPAKLLHIFTIIIVLASYYASRELFRLGSIILLRLNHPAFRNDS